MNLTLLKRFVANVRALSRRHWQKALRIRERVFLSEEAFHLLVAIGVGLIGGTVNVIFYLSVERVQEILTRQQGHNIVEVAEALDWQSRLLLPAFGGLAAGMVIFWGLRFSGKPVTTNLLEVVVAGDGRLPLRAGIVRIISSMITLGTGGSIGREGGITQLSATAASKCGQWAGWQPYRLRLMVACGAAAGMAAAYNAPITGAVFAAHIVLGNFSMNVFAPLLCSSVVATMLSRSFFGVNLWYEVPSFDFTSIAQLPWFLVLGFLAGLLGAAFLKSLRYSQDLFRRIPTLYIRMAVGGLAVGIIAIWFPEVWGNGYVITNRMIQHPMALKSAVPIFIFKFVATLMTVGSGAVGGVITPTLFLGAGLGSILGTTLQYWGLSPAHVPIGIYALVGMGSVFSATTRSPLLALIMVFEISLNYSLMPALMLGCAVSTVVSRLLHPQSIYTEPLRLRSLEVESSRLGSAIEQTVGDLMRAPVPPVRDNTPLPDIAQRFLSSSNNFLPVVDSRQSLLGIVALQDLKEYLGAGSELTLIIAGDVMRPVPPCLRPGQNLLDALPILLASEQRNVPVVNNYEENRLVGSVPRADALAVLSEAIAASTTTISSNEPSAKQTQQPQPLPPPAK